MYQFLQVLSDWLIAQNVIPPVATSDDEDQENKTFWQNMPDDTGGVGNCYLLKQYDTSGDSYKNKEALMYAMQIVVRNISHTQAMVKSEVVYKCLHNRPDYIEDVTWVDDEEITHTGYFIVKCDNAPVKLTEDSQGRFQYSISFYVTTNI